MINKRLIQYVLSLSFVTGVSFAIANTNDRTINIILKDGVVTPQLIDAKTDSTIVISVTNKGKGTAEFESKSLHVEKILMSGASATFTFKNLAVGEYDFVDEFTEDKKTAHGVIRDK